MPDPKPEKVDWMRLTIMPCWSATQRYDVPPRSGSLGSGSNARSPMSARRLAAYSWESKASTGTSACSGSAMKRWASTKANFIASIWRW